MRALVSFKKVTDNFVFTFFPRRIVYLPKFCKPHYTTSGGHLQPSKGRITVSPRLRGNAGNWRSQGYSSDFRQLPFFCVVFFTFLLFFACSNRNGRMKSSAVWINSQISNNMLQTMLEAELFAKFCLLTSTADF